MKRKVSSSISLRRSKRQRVAPNPKHVLDSQTSIPPRSSLLGLPVELRLQILGYLLPDCTVIPHRDYYEGQITHPTVFPATTYGLGRYQLALHLNTNTPSQTGLRTIKNLLDGYLPLRENLESCWPNILRVNHQLYQEAFPLMYKGKTFKARIDEEGLQVCGHQFRFHRETLEQFFSDLPEAVRNIESLHLDVQHGCGGDADDVKRLVLLTSSLANSLAASGSLKRLQVALRVYDWEFEIAVEKLETSEETDLRSALKPFLQLRNLEFAHVEIEGWQEDYDEDEDDDDSSSEKSDFPSRTNCQTSQSFSKYLERWMYLVCSDSRVTQKQSRVDLYLRYRRQHEFLFTGNPEFENFEGRQAQDDLLERAWKACERADLSAYEKVLQDTGNRWARLQLEATDRLEHLFKDVENEKAMIQTRASKPNLRSTR